MLKQNTYVIAEKQTAKEEYVFTRLNYFLDNKPIKITVKKTAVKTAVAHEKNKKFINRKSANLLENEPLRFALRRHADNLF